MSLLDVFLTQCPQIVLKTPLCNSPLDHMQSVGKFSFYQRGGKNWGQSKFIAGIKDVRGRQFLTIKAAENLCIVCLPPEEHIFPGKNIWAKESHFIRV